MNKPICIGKIDSNHNFLDEATLHKNQRCRLLSINPNKIMDKDYSLISCDHEYVLFSESKYIHREFFSKIKSDSIKNILVLTALERNLLLDLICEYEVKVYVFEEIYPFFDDIFYSKILKKNISNLKKLLLTTKKYNFRGVGANKLLTAKFRYIQERKLRFKNSIDNYLFFSCYPAYQEIFKLKEIRPNRKIYALDFNSMYGSCMSGAYPDPKNLKFTKIDKSINLENLDEGFYQVELIEAKDLPIIKYLPFKYSSYLSSYLFDIKPGDSIKAFIAKPELLTLSQYFNDINLISKISSTSTIEHPLYQVNRIMYLDKNNETMKNSRNFNKYSMVISSSIGKHKKYTKINFKSIGECVAYIEKKYFLESKESNYNNDQKMNIFASKGLIKSVKYEESTVQAFILDYVDSESIYCLYSYMLAYSRIKMLKLIESIIKLDDAEICYSNVDSIHVSISEENEYLLLKLLDSHPSSILGGLKIEAIGSKAYWLDIGRYWIYNGIELVKYKNIYFNDKYSTSPFKYLKLNYQKNNIMGMQYIKKKYMNLKYMFSYSKKIDRPIIDIDNIHFIRYCFRDVVNTSVAQFSVYNERISSLLEKEKLFIELSTVKCSSGTTTQLLT